MAASTYLGLVPRDDPMFSGGPQIFSRRISRASATNTDAETQGKSIPEKSPSSDSEEEKAPR